MAYGIWTSEIPWCIISFPVEVAIICHHNVIFLKKKKYISKKNILYCDCLGWSNLPIVFFLLGCVLIGQLASTETAEPQSQTPWVTALQLAVKPKAETRSGEIFTVIWGCPGVHSHGGTKKKLDGFMEDPKEKWMNRATSISGNLHLSVSLYS
jgi:hypothetical protein